MLTKAYVFYGRKCHSWGIGRQIRRNTFTDDFYIIKTQEYYWTTVHLEKSLKYTYKSLEPSF